MSNYFFTSDELLASIKRRAMIPSHQNTFSNQDFLDFATEEMNMGIVPTVLELHEDYYLYETIVPLVDGVTKYEIPYRAIGNKIRDVSLVDSNGNYSSLARVGIGDLPNWSGANQTYAFYIASNEVCLIKNPNASYNGNSLSISFYLRPNSLVPNNETATITAIDFNTGVINVSAIPTGFSINNKIDFIQYKSPHKILKYDVDVTSIDNIGMTLSFDPLILPSSLSVGDRICLATQTCIAQIPSDMHVMLAVRVATRLLEAIGDTEGLKNANQKLAELENKTQVLINNRVDDAPRKIVNRNSILRTGLVRRRGRF